MKTVGGPVGPLVLPEPPKPGLDELLIEVGGGRLVTITVDPPTPERGIAVADVHVRADGAQLAELVGSLGAGALRIHVAAAYPIGQASEALASAASGRAGGAIVLRPSDSTA